MSQQHRPRPPLRQLREDGVDRARRTRVDEDAVALPDADDAVEAEVPGVDQAGRGHGRAPYKAAAAAADGSDLEWRP